MNIVIVDDCASEIAQHLWISGTPPIGNVLSKDFDRLILADSGYQPDDRDYPGVQVLHVPLQDHKLTPQEQIAAVQAGRVVAGWMRRGKNVLVTCQMGLNRSALIAAIALMTLCCTHEEAIKKVRAARGDLALHNPHFLDLLRRLGDVHEFRLASGT